jgi:hypothetical protein
LLDLGHFLVYKFGRIPWTGDQSLRKAANCTHRTSQIQNKRKQTSMPQVGFEPTIPVCKQAKTFMPLESVGMLCFPSGPLCPCFTQLNYASLKFDKLIVFVSRVFRSKTENAILLDCKSKCPAAGLCSAGLPTRACSSGRWNSIKGHSFPETQSICHSSAG